MTPLTLADADRDLVTAMRHGTHDQIAAAADLVDRLDTGAPVVTLHAAALWYAEQGLHVFPLTPGTKVPLKGSAGCKDATNSPDQVNTWWTTTPDANIGIATGHLVDVIDIDGPTGATSWARYADDLPPLIGRVSTPRPGGNHLYTLAVPGRGNKAGLLPGVDYRGHGGYVVAPPSVIADGKNPGVYSWHAPIDVTQLATAVAA